MQAWVGSCRSGWWPAPNSHGAIIAAYVIATGISRAILVRFDVRVEFGRFFLDFLKFETAQVSSTICQMTKASLIKEDFKI